jgi:N-acetylneuraminate synthase/sialic acid synthase
MRELQIGTMPLNDQSDCYVIAEIGHNHMGNINVCRELFRVAKESGANAVKLQKRNNRALYTQAMYNKPYDHQNSYGKTYGEHRDFLEFTIEQYTELKAYADSLEIDFISTAFDFDSADFLQPLDMAAYKIASGDLKNIPLIKYVAGFGKPVIISTGGAVMEDVQRAFDAATTINPQVSILQCTSGYPAAFEELNLRVIQTYRDRFPDTVIGWSGHDNGIAMAVAAYVMGARIIEKHFTLNRANKGTDHAFSLEPIGLTKLVRDLHRTRLAFGNGIKAPYESERDPLMKMGKKIVAARAIPAGTILQRQDLTLKSPADEGLPPYELEKLIGHSVTVDLQEDDAITFDLLKG